MAKVVRNKSGKGFCVVHGRTGKVLVRKGKRACYTGKGALKLAKKDAKDTKCRNMGVCQR